MDYEMFLAAEMETPIPTSDLSVLDISCDKKGRYRVEAESKDTFNIVGRLERGMSPMAHVLVRERSK